MSPIQVLKDYFIGKIISVDGERLEVKSCSVKIHTREVETSSFNNSDYPYFESWESFEVLFTNGTTKEYGWSEALVRVVNEF